MIKEAEVLTSLMLIEEQKHEKEREEHAKNDANARIETKRLTNEIKTKRKEVLALTKALHNQEKGRIIQ